MSRNLVSASLLASLVAAAAATGCEKSRPVPLDDLPRHQAQPPVSPGRPVHAAPSVGVPAEAARPEPEATASFSGPVTETMNAAGYTYLKVATAGGEKWAAVAQTTLKVGDRVTVQKAFPMTNFESRTLKRRFPEIFFGELAGAAPPTTPAPVAAAGAGVAGTRAASMSPSAWLPPPTPPTVVTPVPRAEGESGRTVAELYAQKAQLTDRPVAVRGRVTKLNANIMGKNWLHLQDGTGSAASKDHDITVTTQDTTTVGATVLIRGTLRADRDFGSGYRYGLIVEDAKIE